VRCRWMGLALAVLLCAGPLSAAPRRIRVEAMEYPWSAIGRLNIGGRGWCTAVLVSDNSVLTAAHCLWNKARADWWPASSLHFIAGYQGGEAVLHCLVTGYVIADHFRETPALTSSDWAILQLDQPLGRQAGWLGIGKATDLGAAPLLGIVGYPADRPHAMTLDYGCKIVAIGAPAPLLLEDCPAAHGDSGGPLLVFLPGGPLLVGLVVMSVTAPNRMLTGAVPATVLDDRLNFPIAAAAAQLQGIGATPGHPPEPGSPAVATPQQTVAGLAGQSHPAASLAALTRLLLLGLAAPP